MYDISLKHHNSKNFVFTLDMRNMAIRVQNIFHEYYRRFYKIFFARLWEERNEKEKERNNVRNILSFQDTFSALVIPETIRDALFPYWIKRDSRRVACTPAPLVLVIVQFAKCALAYRGNRNYFLRFFSQQMYPRETNSRDTLDRAARNYISKIRQSFTQLLVGFFLTLE